MGGSDPYDDQRGGMPYGGIQVGEEYTDWAQGLMQGAWNRYGEVSAPSGEFDFESGFRGPSGAVGDYWTQAGGMAEEAFPMEEYREAGAALGAEAARDVGDFFANQRTAGGLYSGATQQRMYEAALEPRLQYEMAGQQAQMGLRQNIFERATGIGSTAAQLGLGELQRGTQQYLGQLGLVGQMFGGAAGFGEPTYYFPRQEQQST